MSNGKMRAHMQPTGNRHEVAVVAGAGDGAGVWQSSPSGGPNCSCSWSRRNRVTANEVGNFCLFNCFCFFFVLPLLQTILLAAVAAAGDASSCLPLRTT